MGNKQTNSGWYCGANTTKLLGKPNVIEVVETILGSWIDDYLDSDSEYLGGEIDETYTSFWLIGVAIHASIDGVNEGGIIRWSR